MRLRIGATVGEIMSSILTAQERTKEAEWALEHRYAVEVDSIVVPLRCQLSRAVCDLS